MTREYNEDGWERDDGRDTHGLWEGQRKQAVGGRRGQAWMREFIAALDAMPVHELGEGALVDGTGRACALGVVAIERAVAADGRGGMWAIAARRREREKLVDLVQSEDYDDPYQFEISQDFAIRGLGMTRTLAGEVAVANDEWWHGGRKETPVQRWTRMRAWATSQLVARPPDVEVVS